jgi:long-chain acyl-CoA synthetase
MNTESGEAPWLEHYGASVPRSLRYTDRTVYGEVAFAAKYFPKNIAYEFEGRKVTYREMMREIDHAASCFSELGVAKGDRVLICLPNCPQAIASFYGAMRLGAVSTMVHPLSAKAEIDFYLSNSKAKVAVTLDILYPNFPAIGEGNELSHIVVSSVKDGLSAHKAFLYHIVKGRKDPRPEYVGGVMSWKRFLSLSRDDSVPECSVSVHDPAAILYSGGTTGRSKGVLLSSMNINAASTQTGLMSEDLCEGTTTLSVLPMFHGFGLCVGVHMFLTHGYTCILIPRFTPESYARLVVKKKPNYIAGVPTMYEYMINCSRYTRKADLSHLKGIYCGGDTLTVELKEKVDRFLEEHGCSARIREGYGATECVTASCLTPKTPRRGLHRAPLPDHPVQVPRIGTTTGPIFGGRRDLHMRTVGDDGLRGRAEETASPSGCTVTAEPGSTGDIRLHVGEGYIYFNSASRDDREIGPTYTPAR